MRKLYETKKSQQSEDEIFKLYTHIQSLIHELYFLDVLKEKFLSVEIFLYVLNNIEKKISTTTNGIPLELQIKKQQCEQFQIELKNLTNFELTY